ncbi:MAG: GerMN domain-containing protein [Candidatus Aminicenantes bacterium]|nr:GerMN domain-containing protein [Candidatus Aminicenantes bacterium]
MTVKTRNYLFIALAFIIFFALLFLFFFNKKSGRPEPELLNKETENGIIAEFIKVKLYYLSESSVLLKPVYREIQVPEIREDLYKKFLSLLLAGDNGWITPIPAGVQLRAVFYLPQIKMLVVDFNDILLNEFPSGTTAELEFIYFIVNNICYNFKEIKKVKLLCGGNEIRTLAGHIEMEKAFFPDFSRLKNE